jgi:hypothetical protein
MPFLPISAKICPGAIASDSAAVEHQLALVENDNPGRDVAHGVEIVLDQYGGKAKLAGQLLQRRANGGALDLGQPSRRLVEQDEP